VTEQKKPLIRPGLEAFDQTMRKLVQVPKAELAAEERKWRRKRARKARRQA